MKKLTKLLSVLSAGVLAVCAAPVSAFAGESGEYNFTPEYALGNDLSLYEKGDVDMDGEVTAYDSTMISYQFLFSFLGFSDVLTEDQLKLADLDDERIWDEPNQKWISVTAYDATLVLTYVGLKNAGYEMTMEEFLAEKLK